MFRLVESMHPPSTLSSISPLGASASSPNVERVRRLQEELRRMREERERSVEDDERRRTDVEERLKSCQTALISREEENESLRDDLVDVRKAVLKEEERVREVEGRREEAIRMQGEEEAEELKIQLTRAQHGQSEAQSQLESATKTLRQSRERQSRQERELTRCKQREKDLLSSLETVTKKSAQSDIQIHSLTQRVRQYQKASEKEEVYIRQLDDAKRKIIELEKLLREMSIKVEEVERKRVEGEENMAKSLRISQNVKSDNDVAKELGLRADLEQHQMLLESERKERRGLEIKVRGLEEERQQLAEDMQGAAQHLRLVALQKSAVTEELEEVHAALAELERELNVSRTENDQLRRRSASSPPPPPSSSSASSSASFSSSLGRESTPTSRAKIHVSRTGSIAITRGTEMNKVEERRVEETPPSMIPLPSSSSSSSSRDASRVRVRTNRHGSVDISRGGALTTPVGSGGRGSGGGAETGSLVAGSNEPWSLGSDSSVTSIRRGTYFGTCCLLSGDFLPLFFSFFSV